MNTVNKELNRIQRALVAPKNQRNGFGKYNYRSCEDILEALKPILGDGTVTISDTIIEISGRYYVKATAKFSLGSELIECDGWAREAEDKKGMDASQITGACSSYARKYALNGLFAIDDSKDADTEEPAKRSQPAQQAKPAPIQAAPSLPAINTVDVTIIDYAKAGALHTVTLAAGGKTIEAKTSDNQIGGLAEFNKGKTASAGLQQTAKGVKLATLVIK